MRAMATNAYLVWSVLALSCAAAAWWRGQRVGPLGPIYFFAGWLAGELALQWLYWRLSRRVRATLEALSGEALPEMGDVSLQTGQIRQTMQACFRQMAQIRELRRLNKGGINAELNLAALLMDWYGGLGHQQPE